MNPVSGPRVVTLGCHPDGKKKEKYPLNRNRALCFSLQGPFMPMESLYFYDTLGGRGLFSFSPSVLANSLRPHGLWPTRLLCSWDFPGRNTGVGCQWGELCYFPGQENEALEGAGPWDHSVHSRISKTQTKPRSVPAATLLLFPESITQERPRSPLRVSDCLHPLLPCPRR